MAMLTKTESEPGAEPPQPKPARPRTLAPPRANTVAAVLVVAALLGFGVWSLGNLRINFATLLDSVDNASSFLSRILPLDFPPLAEVVPLVGQTLAIVIAATLLSVVLSTPLAIWAAGNTTRNRFTRLSSRGVIVCARAIPDLVLAIIFVRVFGLGILPGVLAMGIHSIGMVGKMYADAIEQIDEGPRTAVKTTGAKRLQQLVSGVLPQVAPAFVANAMHRLDINLRISVILGFVGVSGIGKEIRDALGTLNYPRGIALAVIVLVLIIIMELISGAVRSALLGRRAEPTRGGPVWLVRWIAARARAGRDGEGVAPRSADGAADPPQSQSEPVAEQADEPPQRRLSAPWTISRQLRTAGMVFSAVVMAASVVYVMSGFSITSSRALDMAQRLFPPGTAELEWATLNEALFVTLQIAFAATVIGAVLALPIGTLAARNVAPNSVVAGGLRMFIVFVRGIPELVLAIIFVVMIGLGAVAGTVALAIGAIGLLGKLVADSVEEVDPGVENALIATGANRVQVFFSATLPQALPSFVGHLMYQLDVNVRQATLLGIVGAGGIGYYLLEASRVGRFEVVTLVTLMVFGVVMFLELIAMWLRRTAGAKG